MKEIPRQKVSFKTKKEKNFRYMEETIDAIIENTSFSSNEYHRLLKCEKAYHGILDGADYSYITNPYNTQEERYKRFPAKLRNYNIIKPVIDLLLGEKRKRTIDYQVVCESDDVDTIKNKERMEVLRALLQQMYINALNAAGVQTNQPTREVPDLDKFMEKWETDYRDARALLGQEILDIAYTDLDMDENFVDGFRDWLIYGRVYSYKGAHQKNPVYEIIPPHEIYHHRTPGARFVEDCDWAVRRCEMSGHQLMDRFYDQLQEKLDLLEDQQGSAQINGDPFAHHYSTLRENNTFTVYHVVWKSYTKIGFLDVVNDQGILETIEVDESYKAPEGVEVEWFWVNEIWEGYKVMTNQPFYFGIGPSPVQRGKIDNPSSCKLPYNGRVLSGSWDYWTSPVFDGLPYQLLYNVFHYIFERTVAKNKDKIALLDINMVPRKHGWTEDKFLYYADAMSVAWIDPTNPSPNTQSPSPFNQFQVLDMSLGNYIGALLDMLTAIQQEWESSLGINRQRKGQSAASDGATVTERAVFQSSMINEDMFARFDKFEEIELRGLLEFAREAWKNGKRGTYITDDGVPLVYNIDSSAITDVDLGVYVKMDSKENDKLRQMSELALSFAQNGSSPLTIAEIIDAGSMAKVKQALRKMDKAHQALMEQQRQDTMDAIEAENQAKEREYAHDIELEEVKGDNALDVQELKNLGDISSKEESSEKDSGMTEKERADQRQKDEDQKLSRDEFNYQKERDRIEDKFKEQELAIKRKQANKSSVKTS